MQLFSVVPGLHPMLNERAYRAEDSGCESVYAGTSEWGGVQEVDMYAERSWTEPLG